MTNRILADIDVIVKRIEEAYPGIPDLSKAEVVVLNAKLKSFKPSFSLSQGKDPVYKQQYKKAMAWFGHLEAVVESNEKLAVEELTQPTKTKPRGTGNPPGRPQEYDPVDEARIAQRWAECDGSMTKKQFAAEYSMTVHEFDKLLRRVRARESRERAKH